MAHGATKIKLHTGVKEETRATILGHSHHVDAEGTVVDSIHQRLQNGLYLLADGVDKREVDILRQHLALVVLRGTYTSGIGTSTCVEERET